MILDIVLCRILDCFEYSVIANVLDVSAEVQSGLLVLLFDMASNREDARNGLAHNLDLCKLGSGAAGNLTVPTQVGLDSQSWQMTRLHYSMVCHGMIYGSRFRLRDKNKSVGFKRMPPNKNGHVSQQGEH